MHALLFTYLLRSCFWIPFKLLDLEVSSSYSRGWHFTTGLLSCSSSKLLTFPGFFFFPNIYPKPVLPQAGSMWRWWRECHSPNVVYSSSCVCWKCLETVARRYRKSQLLLPVPHEFIPIWGHTRSAASSVGLSLMKTAFHVFKKGASNQTNPSYQSNHGFVPLLLELQNAQHRVGWRGGPGCLRGWVPCTPSQTFPNL